MFASSARVETAAGLFLLAALSGCGDTQIDQEPLRPATTNYLETGDLDALRKRAQLRILMLRKSDEYEFLPRVESELDVELRFATDFARSMQLDPVVVYVDKPSDLILALREGRGDLAATYLAATDERSELIEFTVPLKHTRQVILRRKGDEITKRKQLQGRTLAVGKSTPYWDTALALAGRYDKLMIEQLDEELDQEEVLELLANGAIDLTIYDSVRLAEATHYHDEIEAAFPVAREQPLAWGLRKSAVQLKAALDRFLNQEQLVRARSQRYVGDFDEIKRRGTLRVVTRNNAATYFLWRGELLGFEYEMTRAFAKAHDLRLEMRVAPSWRQMLPMLLDGDADLAAAFITPTHTRRSMGVEFSRPYSSASEVVVTRADDQQLKSLQDLRGRSFVVRQSSSYWQTLSSLAANYGFSIEAAPEDEETESIIAKVAEGTYDLTLADSNILAIELGWRDDVREAISIGEPIDHGWAVRAGDSVLLEQINLFLKKQYRSAFYNITYAKYFKSESRIRRHKEERVDLSVDGVLSPYDDIVKRYAGEYGFDWRLVLAQMYQESRFDPAAESWAGARGLMQVLPRTARQIGMDGDLSDPEYGIHAGVKYLAWMRERFAPDLPVQDRMWMTLAAYNAGREHLRDARRLARRMGWKSNRWFDNTERAIVLLSKKKYARASRAGYVRGGQTVHYVREIKQRYDAYVRLTQSTACADCGSATN